MGAGSPGGHGEASDEEHEDGAPQPDDVDCRHDAGNQSLRSIVRLIHAAIPMHLARGSCDLPLNLRQEEQALRFWLGSLAIHGLIADVLLRGCRKLPFSANCFAAALRIYPWATSNQVGRTNTAVGMDRAVEIYSSRSQPQEIHSTQY